MVDIDTSIISKPDTVNFVKFPDVYVEQLRKSLAQIDLTLIGNKALTR